MVSIYRPLDYEPSTSMLLLHSTCTHCVSLLFSFAFLWKNIGRHLFYLPIGHLHDLFREVAIHLLSKVFYEIIFCAFFLLFVLFFLLCFCFVFFFALFTFLLSFTFCAFFFLIPWALTFCQMSVEKIFSIRFVEYCLNFWYIWPLLIQVHIHFYNSSFVVRFFSPGFTTNL